MEMEMRFTLPNSERMGSTVRMPTISIISMTLKSAELS